MTNDHNLDDLRAAITASREQLIRNLESADAGTQADQMITDWLATADQFQPCYLTYANHRTPAWLTPNRNTFEDEGEQTEMAEFMLTRQQDPSRFEGMADLYTIAYGWCPVDQITLAEAAG